MEKAFLYAGTYFAICSSKYIQLHAKLSSLVHPIYPLLAISHYRTFPLPYCLAFVTSF